MKRFLTLFLVLILINVYNAGDFCPEKIQAVLLSKVITFTKEIGGKPKGAITLGVVNGGPMLDALKSSIKDPNITVKQISADEITAANIIYLPKGTPTDILQTAASTGKSSKIFTIAGDINAMLNHDLTLSFHMVNGKPRMIVSPESATEEGVKFSPMFLKIAETK